MARRRAATGRERDEAKRAKDVADKYFDLDRSTDESDEEARRRHLDDGFDTGAPKPKPGTKAPPPPPPKPVRLTIKQTLFIQEYLVDFNGTQAAIRAGYSAHSAAMASYENLRKPEIKKLIDEALKERAAAATWNADMLLYRLGQELTADLADLFDDAGNMLPIKQWPMIFRTGLVAGIDVEEFTRIDEAGDIVPGIVRKLKLSDRSKRLELLGKHKAVQAWRELKEIDVPKDSPLARLARELDGTALRPREIAGPNPEAKDEP